MFVQVTFCRKVIQYGSWILAGHQAAVAVPLTWGWSGIGDHGGQGRYPHCRVGPPEQLFANVEDFYDVSVWRQ
jgi:hypothetical protein